MIQRYMDSAAAEKTFNSEHEDSIQLMEKLVKSLVNRAYSAATEAADGRTR